MLSFFVDLANKFMLEAKQLSHRFGVRIVLKNLEFQVQSGACIAVVGRNGAGKSTLLRLVAGLLEPSRGVVSWNNQKTRPFCALAAPDAPLYRELTCLENLKFFAQTRDEALLRLHLEKWDLENRTSDLAGDLSSGLRVRLQLAVAAWFERPILLLDEPSANLDASGRDLVKRLVAEQKTRGVTLLATNDARDLELCDARIEIT
ncbi:heme exporter protein A [Abditibacterium utsteinense]|uniref:Heme exporter protein A n=1 Tax=Abditibacterium utsteinense TaxID=1960156 RepID=A0A2S8SXL5_9BACT|nr:ABC transporter ATP-binding protein [Abditibacterium utsteinense]PQV65508.1 heme exporter protein A [Abditibacterium utsteinense]